MSPRRLAVTIAGGVIVLDQITKAWAVAALSDGPISVVDGLFQLRLVRNPGAAFGQLRGAGSILALIAIAVAAVIFLNLKSLQSSLEAGLLGAIMGGALGNLIDRMVRGDGFFDGKVIDFLDFDFWPTFNVADIAISVGAVLAILVSLWVTRAESRSPTS